MVTTGLMTAEEFEQLHDDFWRYELIRGEVLRMPPSGEQHSRIAGRIVKYIAQAMVGHDYGEIYIAEGGFLLARDPDVVVAPDAAFVRAERVSTGGGQTSFSEVAPDIVLEVTSPSDRVNMVMAKINEYLRAGVKLIWLVDPELQTVTVFRPAMQPEELSGDDVLEAGDLIPEFRVPISDIFKDLGS